MKTNKFLLKGIILMVLFNMILIELSAQEKNADLKVKKNPHEQATSPPSPPSPPSPTPPPPPSPPPPPPDADQDDMRPILNLSDLTDEQQAKIKKIDLKQMETMTPLRNQLREKRVHLLSILTTMPVDMKTADQVADEIGKVAASILKEQIRHDQELRNLLTPDQQIIFDSRPKPFLRRPK